MNAKQNNGISGMTERVQAPLTDALEWLDVARKEKPAHLGKILDKVEAGILHSRDGLNDFTAVNAMLPTLEQFILEMGKPLLPLDIQLTLALETLEDDPANVAELARQLTAAKNDLTRLQKMVKRTWAKLKAADLYATETAV